MTSEAPAAEATIAADGPQFTVEIISDFRRFVALEAEWQELHAAAVRPTVFLAHKYLRLSWEQIWRRPGNRLLVVLVRDNGRLVMAAAFAKAFRRLLPSLHFLGFGTPQYEDVLWRASAHTAAQAEAVLTALRASVWRPRRLFAQRLREDSPFRQAAQGAGLVFKPRWRLEATLIELNAYPDFATYFATLSQNLKVDHRRRMRRFAEMEGFAFAFETGAGRDEALRWLFDSKRDWLTRTGKQADWLENGSIDRFTADLLQGNDAPQSWVVTLRAEGRIVAATLCFPEQDVINYSKITHDPAYEKHSPGRTLTLLLIEAAFAGGYRLFDFGQGSLGWKQRLGTVSYAVCKEDIWIK